MIMKIISGLLAMMWASLVMAQQPVVSGRLVDTSTGDGVSFSTVHIGGTSLGTITNMEGYFSLKIPSQFVEDTLIVSSMGFESQQLLISPLLNSSRTIAMKPSVVHLASVTVRPISAMEILKNSVRQFDELYGHQFSANAYFRQISYDDETMLQHSEGYIQAYFEDFLDDTTAIDQRILLHNIQEDLDKLNFRTRKIDKKLAKAKKRADKEGYELNEDSVKNKARKMTLGLVTPDMLMDMDPVRQNEAFLDTTLMNDFRYEFEEDIKYQGRSVTVISFSSKRKVKLVNMGIKGHLNGTIYLDIESDAILGVDYTSEMVIPAAVRPILFLMGFGVENPMMTNKVRYMQVAEQWYPQSIQVDMGLDITQRYLFKENERSYIDAELLMAVSNIEYNNPQQIVESHKFTSKKKLEEQVYPKANVTWEMVNRIALETVQ